MIKIIKKLISFLLFQIILWILFGRNIVLYYNIILFIIEPSIIKYFSLKINEISLIPIIYIDYLIESFFSIKMNHKYNFD
jgi:hypothetical protein